MKQVSGISVTTGNFTLRSGRRILLAGLTAHVIYRDADGQPHTLTLPNLPTIQVNAEGWSVTSSDGRVRMDWRVSKKGEFTLEIKNEGTGIVRLDELCVLALDTRGNAEINLGAVDDLRWLEHGWQSWSPTRLISLARPERKTDRNEEYLSMHVPHPGGDWTHRAEWFTLFGNARQAVLLGFVTAGRQLSEVRIKNDAGKIHRLEAVCFADGITLAPDEMYLSERLVVAVGEPLALVEMYADRVGVEMHARVQKKVPTGWCTWYQYYGENTMDDVRGNLESIRANRLPLDVIIIDDGYQTAIGDWTDIRPDKFPDGMRAAADEIRRAGHTPAIWMAPFGADANSKLVQAHPEYLLRDEKGEPVKAWEHWGNPILSLDLTHPAVEKFLRELFRTVGEEWGYEFFKLDFLFAGARSGVYYDRKMTRAEAYRRGLEIIRESIGEKFLLACGAPMAATVGFADAMRVGADVVGLPALWERPLELSEPAVSNALRDTFTRWAFHGRWWLNDADCVVLRRGNAGGGLTAGEIRTLASGIALSGGLTLDSDDLALLREQDLDMLRRIMPPTNVAARPVDLFASDLPGRFELPVKTEWGSWRILAALNWGIQPKDAEIALGGNGTYHVFDFWSHRYLGVHRGKVKLKGIKRHATALLVVKPVSKQVELLATTFHSPVTTAPLGAPIAGSTIPICRFVPTLDFFVTRSACRSAASRLLRPESAS